MPVSNTTYYSFDDFSILAAPTQGSPSEVELRTTIARGIELSLPILSAAMPSITGARMAIAMGEFGALGVMHKYCSIEEQLAMVNQVRQHSVDRTLFPHASIDAQGKLMAAASISPGDWERAKALCDAGAAVLFIDTPIPTHMDCFSFVRKLRAELPTRLVIGSVIDTQTAKNYIELGVDGIKVGLGSGAMCSMRRATGVGAPQATAIQSIAAVAANAEIPVISDGAVRCSGDIVKALALGASGVMVGSQLGGCSETPTKLIQNDDGTTSKLLDGLILDFLEVQYPTGLPEVDQYLQAHSSPRAEGGSRIVSHTGPCHLSLLQLQRGIRGGVHMAGAQNLSALQKNANLIQVSMAGSSEAYLQTR